VTNAELEITLTSLPNQFRVAANQGRELVLEPTDSERGGRLAFAVEKPDYGINMVEAVNRHQQRIETLPQGEYKGGQELMGPLGSAFWSRGRHGEGPSLTEEALVVTLHPSGPALFTLTYSYPAGDDSQERMEELLAVLAEVEP